AAFTSTARPAFVRRSIASHSARTVSASTPRAWATRYSATTPQSAFPVRSENAHRQNDSTSNPNGRPAKWKGSAPALCATSILPYEVIFVASPIRSQASVARATSTWYAGRSVALLELELAQRLDLLAPMLWVQSRGWNRSIL